jgi:thiamine-monophosphate kinase
MSEQSLVEWIRRRTGRVRERRVVLGIGDDCAIYRPTPGEDLVFTTDFVIESVHFHSDDPAEACGAKALARGLSDIAAMGAEPRFALISVAGPEERAIRHFYTGLLKWKIPIAGGDVARAQKLTCDVVVCGAVPRGKALQRDGARPGDRIYVSGKLGAAAAREYHVPPVPRPRLDLGRRLRGRATACMDISDGLSTDLLRLCTASGVAGHVERVPAAPGATREQALHGGDDYELLYTGPEGLEGIDIGYVLKGSPAVNVEPRGWDHFTYNGHR